MKRWKIDLPTLCAQEHTPLVDHLLDLLQERNRRIDILTDEIKRLKDHKKKPKLSPSKLGNGEKKSSSSHGKKSNRKGQSTSSKKRSVDRTEIIKVDIVPEGSQFKGYLSYYVQELIIQVEKIEYKLERWQLPNGAYVVAPLPKSLSNSHFGSVFKSYALHQYHHQGVTQPLLLAQLRAFGARLSSGQLSRLLIDDKTGFHNEKAGILSAGLAVSSHLHVDDTGARHQGNNGYCTHIGNELFAWFKSTESKSRINFLELLRDAYDDYWLTEGSFAYMRRYQVAPWIQNTLNAYKDQLFKDKAAWENCFELCGITHNHSRRLVTESALIGSLLHHGFSKELVIISDDAGQLNVFQHALCWIHAERLITTLIPSSTTQAEEMEWARSEIWDLYHALVEYKARPTKKKKIAITAQYHQFCTTKIHWRLLELALKRLGKNKDELLLVLERPDIPLHNNLSESDIREYVKRRKISGSTRSEAGWRCRDTFASLKKTALKLGVLFWDYLLDRTSLTNEIPQLSELITKNALLA